jgi:dCMP deaminase
MAELFTIKWHKRFLELAQHISTWSKDPSTRVGVVAVSPDKQILSVGYNGFPRGVSDYPARLSDRETKYRLTSHAEMNCIYNAVHNGVPLKGSFLYVYGCPVCCECAKGIIQAGISEVIIQEINKDKALYDEKYANWYDSWKHSVELFNEAGLYAYELSENKKLKMAK